jgi:hypothetical protein
MIVIKNKIMLKIRFLLFFLYIKLLAMSQYADSSLVIDTNQLRSFISAHAVPFFQSPAILGTDEIPFSIYKVNRKIETQGIAYTLYGMPLIEMYAYVEENKQFCFYAVLSYEKGFNPLVDAIGMPDNVTADDFYALDFDFLSWDSRKDAEVFIFPNRKYKLRKTCLLFITTIDSDKLIRVQKDE